MVVDIFTLVPRAFLESSLSESETETTTGAGSSQTTSVNTTTTRSSSSQILVVKRYKWKHSEMAQIIKEQIGRILGVILPLTFTTEEASGRMANHRHHPRLLWGSSADDVVMDGARG